MTNLLDDLRHANPVDPDTLNVPALARHTHPLAPRRSWKLTLAATGAALLIVAAIAFIPGRAANHHDTLAARAYAAVTKPGVVHWRTALRTHAGGQGHTQTIIEGWSHSGVSHMVMWELYNDKPQLKLDTRTAEGRTTTWTGAEDHLVHSKARPTGSDPNTFGDPMATFRRAYKTGKLSPLGPNRLKVDLPGRADNESQFTAYYDIDPKTSLPRRYVLTSRNGSTTTLQFRVYETLPFDESTRTKLRLLDHPTPASQSTTATEHFAVLRRGTPPTGKLGAAITSIARYRHYDASAARKLAPGIALVPTKDGICLITVTATGVGAGCAGLTHALKRGLGTGVPNPPPAQTTGKITGIKAGVDLAVPDQVIAVKTRFHGKWTRRPVHGNFIHLPRFSGQYALIRR